MKKNFKILFVVLVTITGLVIITQAIVWFQAYNEEIKGQKTVESYLEEKYGQDFVVEKPIHKGYGFAVEGVLEAIAYPKDKPDLKFTATTNSQGSDDEYPGAFWQQQAYTYVKPIIEKVFEYVPEYTIQIIIYPSRDNPIKGALPDFSEALIKYQPQMGLLLTVMSRERIDISSKTLVAQRTHGIAENLKKLGVTYVSVDYRGPSGGGLSYKLGGPNYPELPPSQPKQIQELINLVKEGE